MFTIVPGRWVQFVSVWGPLVILRSGYYGLSWSSMIRLDASVRSSMLPVGIIDGKKSKSSGIKCQRMFIAKKHTPLFCLI